MTGGSAVGGQISPAEVLARAQYWTLRPPPTGYDQGNSTPDPDGKFYRSDCSGFVSMCWHLAGSLTTADIPGATVRIDPADLQPGDAICASSALNGGSGHVVLFDHWVTGHSSYFGHEFGQGSSPLHHEIPYPYFPSDSRTYLAYHYPNLGGTYVPAPWEPVVGGLGDPMVDGPGVIPTVTVFSTPGHYFWSKPPTGTIAYFYLVGGGGSGGWGEPYGWGTATGPPEPWGVWSDEILPDMWGDGTADPNGTTGIGSGGSGGGGGGVVIGYCSLDELDGDTGLEVIVGVAGGTGDSYLGAGGASQFASGAWAGGGCNGHYWGAVGGGGGLGFNNDSVGTVYTGQTGGHQPMDAPGGGFGSGTDPAAPPSPYAPSGVYGVGGDGAPGYWIHYYWIYGLNGSRGYSTGFNDPVLPSYERIPHDRQPPPGERGYQEYGKVGFPGFVVIRTGGPARPIPVPVPPGGDLRPPKGDTGTSKPLEQYLRMTQRDDGRGVQKHPRLQVPGANEASSKQSKSIRLGETNTYR